MKQLRVVSIGGYGHSPMVFDEMLSMPEVRFVAFAPALQGENLDIVTAHPICGEAKLFEDYRKMLSDVECEVAVVATRLDRIPHVAIHAANSGCHLICEKPLATTHEGLEALHSAVSANDVRIIAMLTARSHPAFAAAQALYARGDIGQAVVINVRKSYKWGVRPSWFGDRQQYGGTIGWVGIHALDFINSITQAEFKSVAAMQSTFAHKDFPGCQDNCVLILELDTGARATVSIDYLRPDAAASHGDDWIRIVGTAGSIEVSGKDNTCSVLAKGAEPVMVGLVEPPKTFASFLQSLTGRAEQQTQFANAFMLTHACLCARDAAETNSVVEIGTAYCD